MLDLVVCSYHGCPDICFPETIEKWFKASAKGNVIAEGSAKTGQLFRDIIAAHGNTKIRWSFDARAGAIGKEGLFKILGESVEENLDMLAGAIGTNIVEIADRKRFLDETLTKLKANFDFEISDI